LKKSPNR